MSECLGFKLTLTRRTDQVALPMATDGRLLAGGGAQSPCKGAIYGAMSEYNMRTEKPSKCGQEPWLGTSAPFGELVASRSYQLPCQR